MNLFDSKKMDGLKQSFLDLFFNILLSDEFVTDIPRYAMHCVFAK